MIIIIMVLKLENAENARKTFPKITQRPTHSTTNASRKLKKDRRKLEKRKRRSQTTNRVIRKKRQIVRKLTTSLSAVIMSYVATTFPTITDGPSIQGAKVT